MTKYKKVLLVEDDPITIMVCDRILKMTEFGTEIISKTNGHDAIAYLKHLIETKDEIPEIIFLDINMPVMNGWDFLSEFTELEKLFNFIPKVFILSSTVDPEDTRKAQSYDCVVGSISKPLTKVHLEEIV